MNFIVSFLRKRWATDSTFMGFLPFVNIFEVGVYMWILCECGLTNRTLIGPLSFMNCLDMNFQIMFSATRCRTDIEFKRFFPSWTASMCLFKRAFALNEDVQILHRNGLLPSWTDSMWLSNFAEAGLNIRLIVETDAKKVNWYFRQ